jgi:pimeloyl-ACP methyl ester carboxylesterase
MASQGPSSGNEGHACRASSHLRENPGPRPGSIPSWYMVATDDQMIPPQAEEFMAKRMDAAVRTVPSSHAAMVSHSKEVTDLIVLAAESTGKPLKTSHA